MKNYWITRVAKKRLLRQIDDKLVDSWVENETIGEFIERLTPKEKRFFLSLKIIDTGAELTNNQIDLSINFEG